VGDLTFTITLPSDEFFSGSIDRFFHPNPWTPLIPGNQIAISDVENLNVDLVNPVYSLGFEIVEMDIYNPNGISTGVSSIDSTFAVTLLNDGAFIDEFKFNAPDDVAAFVGVWGDSAFDRVEIREIDGDTKGEYFGQFYTGTTPVP